MEIARGLTTSTVLGPLYSTLISVGWFHVPLASR